MRDRGGKGGRYRGGEWERGERKTREGCGEMEAGGRDRCRYFQLS